MIATKITTLYNDFENLNDNEGKIIVKYISDVNPKFLKNVVDMLNDKHKESVIVLAACDETTKKVSVIVKINDKYVSKDLDAKIVLNEILEKLNGKGGGKPNYAQGSGNCSNDVNLDKILLEIKEKIISKIC